MARSTQPPPPIIAELTASQIHTAISRIQKRVDELEQFNVNGIRGSFDPTLNALETSIEATLSAVFGNNTVQYKRYLGASQIDYKAYFFGQNETPIGEIRGAVSRNREHAIVTLKQAIKDLQEELEHLPPEIPMARTSGKSSPSKNKVFIVHGHDDAALEGLARFLEKLELEVIILKEQPNQGRTIIEKFEDSSDQVGYAIVLMTPDDLGAAVSTSSQNFRARQNVVFELGYFVGKLRRGCVCLLKKGAVEIPSDLFGVVYTEMDAAGGWKQAIVQEMKAAKLSFDANKLWG